MGTPLVASLAFSCGSTRDHIRIGRQRKIATGHIGFLPCRRQVPTGKQAKVEAQQFGEVS